METNRLSQGSSCVARPTLVRERRGELGAGFQTPGTDRQRAPRRRGRLAEVSLLEQRLAQIDVRVDEVGFDRDRPTIATDRLLEFALVLERIAEVACFAAARRCVRFIWFIRLGAPLGKLVNPP
jgi:hypothetical protein